MEDAGFIISAYVLTFAVVLGYVSAVVRRGRRAAERLPDESKPWL